jgi:hypothetical protein
MRLHGLDRQRMGTKQGKMDVLAATFSQKDLCQITGLDTVTARQTAFSCISY